MSLSRRDLGLLARRIDDADAAAEQAGGGERATREWKTGMNEAPIRPGWARAQNV